MTYVGLGTRLVKHTEQLNPMSLGKKGGGWFSGTPPQQHLAYNLYQVIQINTCDYSWWYGCFDRNLKYTMLVQLLYAD